MFGKKNKPLTYWTVFLITIQQVVYYFGKQKLYTLTERYYQVYHRELHSVGTDFRDSWGEWARYVTDDMFLFGTENPIQSEITGEPGMIYFKYPLNYTEGD